MSGKGTHKVHQVWVSEDGFTWARHHLYEDQTESLLKFLADLFGPLHMAQVGWFSYAFVDTYTKACVAVGWHPPQKGPPP